MKIAPFQSLKERIPGFNAEKTEQAPSPVHPYDLDEVATALDEARRIEMARTELITRSDEIRLGSDPHPERTIRVLAHAAEFLVDSAAPEWEKATTLSEAAANLIGSDTKSPSTQHIARLAIATLQQAFPERPDAYIDRLNKDEIRARTGAMTHTSAEVPYSEALEQQWTELNHPLEPLIDRTEDLVNEMWEKKEKEAAEQAKAKAEAELLAAKVEAAKPRSEKFDPFAEDDEEETEDSERAA